MTAEELRALIAQGEGEALEFKRSVAEMDKVVEVVAAFANTRGGTALIGVHQDGRIDGVEVGQTTRERIASRITANTAPTVYPSVEHVTVEGRVVVVIAVAESENKPHMAFGRAFKQIGRAHV